MKNQTKMLLGGAVVLGLGYYLYNMKNEPREGYYNAVGRLPNGGTPDGRTGLKWWQRLFG